MELETRNLIRYGLIAAAGAALSSLFVSQTTRQWTAEPDYDTTKREGNVAIREYGPAIAAQVEVEGVRHEAIKRGFRLLADFIFGDNLDAKKIAMTTPVIQQDSQQIEMTAPATQRGAGNKWTVQFIMPEHYTLDTLPQPNNPLIAIREVPERQVAVIRFAGSSTNNVRIEQKIAELDAYVDAHDLEAVGAPIIAFYDPPWTLPFLRRNEIMIELKTAAKLAEQTTIDETSDETPKTYSKPKLAKKS